MTEPAPKKPLWPRTAVGPLGNSARFACMGDVPAGWTLETLLPGDAFKIENVYAVADDPVELAKVRAEYLTFFGKKPGPTWHVATIREKIAEGL